jgi:hypothetical protein
VALGEQWDDIKESVQEDTSAIATAACQCPRSTSINGGNAGITDLDIALHFETLDISVRHEPIFWMAQKTTDVAAARLLVWSTTD